jgi:hypothetical protein
MVAVAALYCAITGVDGPNGVAPVYTHIPQIFLATCMGLSQHFPTNGDKVRLAACIEHIQTAFRASGGSSGSPTPAPMDTAVHAADPSPTLHHVLRAAVLSCWAYRRGHDFYFLFLVFAAVFL